jgi:hypothetical protein
VVPVTDDEEHPDYTLDLFVHWADLKYLREHNQVFEGLIGSHEGRAVVQQGARTFQFRSGQVTADAFEFYGVPALLGRTIVSEDGRPEAAPVFVMSYDGRRV